MRLQTARRVVGEAMGCLRESSRAWGGSLAVRCESTLPSPEMPNVVPGGTGPAKARGPEDDAGPQQQSSGFQQDQTQSGGLRGRESVGHVPEGEQKVVHSGDNTPKDLSPDPSQAQAMDDAIGGEQGPKATRGVQSGQAPPQQGTPPGLAVDQADKEATGVAAGEDSRGKGPDEGGDVPTAGSAAGSGTLNPSKGPTGVPADAEAVGADNMPGPAMGGSRPGTGR